MRREARRSRTKTIEAFLPFFAASDHTFDWASSFDFLGRLAFVSVAAGIACWVAYWIIAEWMEHARIRRLPIQQVRASVVSKRQDVEGERVRTTYFVTFALEGDRRREFQVEGEVFGLLMVGDEGVLSRQGPLFVDFHRRKKKRTQHPPNR